MPRSTRRTAAQPTMDKENATTTFSKKPRHRLSTTELARLEDVFRQETHPSRQQKRELAAQLGMDYKTVTIWFQNKRQTAKRGQPPAQRPDGGPVGRARADSCLRAVSSPSHNATLSGVVPAASSSEVKSKSIASKIKPLLDSLNAVASRPRELLMEAKGEAPDVNVDAQISPEDATASAELTRPDQTPDQEQPDVNLKPVKWKRTLEWACKRHAKRRRLSREGYVRLGSADGDASDAHMDSALSLLSLASSAQVGPPKDVMRGASLLLSFKHTWRRK